MFSALIFSPQNLIVHFSECVYVVVVRINHYLLQRAEVIHDLSCAYLTILQLNALSAKICLSGL